MAPVTLPFFYCGFLRMVRIGSIGLAIYLASLSGGYAASLKIGGTGTALGAMRVTGKAFEMANPGIRVEAPTSLGSGGGIRAAIAEALDIGLSAQRLKDKELKTGGKQRAHAITPFTLVTSNRNVEAALTSRQTVDMFAGQMAQWSDGTPVRLFLLPEDGSGTKILLSGMKGIRPALAKARSLPGIPVGATNQEALSSVEGLPGSLTTSSLTPIIAERRQLRPIAIDAVAPTLGNVVAGNHGMSETLNLVTGSGSNPLANPFIRFMRSPERAALLREIGNLPVTAE